MIEVLNRGRQRRAYLQNAYDVREEETINDIGKLSFRLPASDEKAAYCQPFFFARWIDADTGEKGGLYRIVKTSPTMTDVPSIAYECEHVLSTLADSVMAGYHVVGNLGVYTDEVINYVLSFQTVQNWVLGECDFRRQFEYGWSNETVLNALWSIPNRFVEPYIWVADTSTYPWHISLKRIDTGAPSNYFVRGGHNLLALKATYKSAGVITRIYPLGYGEGDNQLTIKDVNGGVPYLQSSDAIIARYGLIERYWVDRRFEDAQSLKDQAQALLDGLQEPRMIAEVDITDLHQKSHDEHDKIDLGRIVTIVDDDDPDKNIKSYITSVKRNRDIAGSARIAIANKPNDIASSIADLADRQRIEQVYAQGATQIYAQSIQANATTEHGAKLNFYISADMRIVNFVKAKITLARFRSYSRSTRGGGASTHTSSSGGGGASTSSSGGGASKSTENGGDSRHTSGASSKNTTEGGGGFSQTTGAATTSSAVISDATTKAAGQASNTAATGETSGHIHKYWPGLNHKHDVSVYIPLPAHQHYMELPMHTHGMAHTHEVSIPAHSHYFSVPAHTHSVNIPAHTHTVSIPDHTHGIEQGIFEFGSPTGAAIYVNGQQKGSMERNAELDITEYLLNDSNTIPRGSWLSVEVRPNDLAYVTIDLVIKGFCQSRGGMTY